MTVPTFIPQNLDVEQALLGAAILNSEVFTLVDGIVTTADFGEELHQVLWDVMLTLWRAGKRTDVKLVASCIPEHLDKKVGGLTVKQYIARLASEATTVINARDYAQTIRDLSDQRRMQVVGAQLRREILYDVPEMAAEAIEQLDSIISSRVLTGAPGVEMKEAMVRAVDAAAAAYQRDGAITGVTWGVKDLDAKTLGMQPGELVILAGRPGMGKTAMALCAARAAGTLGYTVQVESLEMGDVSLSQRMLADQMFADGGQRVTYYELRAGRFSEDTFYRMQEAAKTLAQLPIRIEQKPGQTLGQIAARARQRKRRKGLDLLIIDHIQLIQASDRYRGNRVQELTEITGGLKALAKELGVPILALSQLGRAVENRDDKRPLLSDLRDSGSIEQDADMIVMLYRRVYYLAQQEPTPGSPEHEKWMMLMEASVNQLEANVVKQRSGPLGRIEMFCDIGANAIRDMVKDRFLPERLADTAAPKTMEF